MNATDLMMKLTALGPHAVAYVASGSAVPSPPVRMTFDLAVSPGHAPPVVSAVMASNSLSLDEACELFAGDEGLASRCLAAFALFEKADAKESSVPSSWTNGLADGLLEAARATPECAQRLHDELDKARGANMMSILDGGNPFADSHLGGLGYINLHMATNVTLAIVVLIANARGVLSRELGGAHKAFFETISNPLLRELVDWSPKPRRERLQELIDNPMNIKLGIAMAGLILSTRPGGSEGLQAVRQFIQIAADADGPRTSEVDDAVAMALESLTFMMKGQDGSDE